MIPNFDIATVLTPEYLSWYVSGTYLTLQLAAIGWVLAFVLSIPIVLMRISAVPPLRWVAATYIEYHRNVPMLVQMLVWYFAVPEILPADLRNYLNSQGSEFIFAAIAIGLGLSAYMAEDLRSGFQSIPKGQFEASKALGFTGTSGGFWIIAPQVMRVSLPPLVGETLFVFKSTALASAIGVMELTLQSKSVANQSFRVFEAFAFGTLIYVVISLALMSFGVLISNRFNLNGSP